MPEMSGKRHVFASQVPLGLASGRTAHPWGVAVGASFARAAGFRRAELPGDAPAFVGCQSGSIGKAHPHGRALSLP